MTNLPEQLQHHLDQIDNEQLRAAITNEFEQLNKRFGLVFERHMPEGVRLPGHRISRGTKVAITHKAGKPVKDPNFYTVASRVTKDTEIVTLADSAGNAFEHPISEIVAAKEFGDITYPGLKVIDQVRRDERPGAPTHTIINGENHHVLEALQWTHSGKVDLIYIDPPYNTGNADWKYNDRYVDSNDGYRHSKWLSFMEKRLLLAKKLLKDTGVIFVAIGDDEHHRLRSLMDQIFGEQNFISNIVWQGGRKNDSRYISNGADYMLVYARDAESLRRNDVRWREDKPGVDEILEQGLRCWNEAASELFQQNEPKWWSDFYLPLKSTSDPSVGGKTPGEVYSSWLEHRDFEFAQELRELSTAKLKSWWKGTPHDHEARGSKHYNHVDELGRVYFPADVSSASGASRKFPVLHPRSSFAVPIPSRGWACSQETMNEWLEEGRIHFGSDHNVGINRKSYLHEITSTVAESVFQADRRASAKHLASILGDKRFPFPKDHEVLARWIRMAAPKDAVVLDFFGGSGTTAESVMRLNAEDGGTRQCILVTNNELAKADDTKLRKAGFQPGDAEYEAQGVFHHVTKPRLKTVATGIREDGSTYSDGLEANLAFLEFKYLEEVDILQGKSINDLAGLFWLKAGGRGTVPVVSPEDVRRGYALSDGMAILLSTGAARELKSEVSTRGINLDALFIVTDSDAQGDEAAALFAGTPAIERIYGPYLEAFQVNKSG